MTTTMIDSVETTTVEDANIYAFSLNDRCDADKGSPRTDGQGVGVAEQAHHRLTKGDLELFLCNHHYVQHESALLTDGWRVESNITALEDMKVRHKVYSEVDGE